MFESIPAAPADPILGLVDAFQGDPNPDKINLGIGVYQDAQGRTPVLRSVKLAEEKLLRAEATKSYLPIAGSPEFARAIARLLFAGLPTAVDLQRATIANTPGGTGALRIAGELLHRFFPGARVWVSRPTWPNHPGIFAAVGMQVESYPYFDAETNSLTLSQMLAAIEAMPAGDVIVLHGCCHNPTGVDPTPAQWRQIAAAVGQRQLLPVVDFAYQGFAEGLQPDADMLDAFCQNGQELLVCSSLSKNFALYNERVGALSVLTRDSQQAAQVQSQVKACIRTCYSNPPAHGAAIATTILQDEELRTLWENELTGMRQRIADMRTLLVDSLRARGVMRDVSFIARQRGMFSFSGLTSEEVETLRTQHSIYIVKSGRINVAGITPANVDRLCDAIAGLWRDSVR